MCPNLNLAIAGIVRLVLKLHPSLSSKPSSRRLLSSVTSVKAAQHLTKPLLASVALWPGSGEDLTSENASVEEKLSKCSRRFEEDNIAEKIAVQVGGGNQGKPTVEEEEEILSSMELDRSDEGVSQPMEELKVDVESRRGKRSSPSTAGGFLGEQKKDEVTGEESCPENKKSRYSAEEEVFFIDYSF